MKRILFVATLIITSVIIGYFVIVALTFVFGGFHLTLFDREGTFTFLDTNKEVILTLKRPKGIKIAQSLDYTKKYSYGIYWGQAWANTRGCWGDVSGVMTINLKNPQKYIERQEKDKTQYSEFMRQIITSPNFQVKKTIGKYEYYFLPANLLPQDNPRNYEGKLVLDTEKGLLEIDILLGNCAKKRTNDQTIYSILESIDIKVPIK